MQSTQHRRTATATTGTLKNLVIPFKFSDHKKRTLPTKSDLNILFNGSEQDCKRKAAVCGKSGSVRKFYNVDSYGKLDLTSVVVDWVQIGMTEAQAAGGNSGLSTAFHDVIRLVLNTLQAREGKTFFGQFDQNRDGNIDFITFLHSGYAAESAGDPAKYSQIWSHKWSLSTGPWRSADGVTVNLYNISPALWGQSGSEIGRIGVIAHELGHFMGAPDMYDTDGGGKGIGAFGLMSSSWGFDGSQWYPAHNDPYTLANFGWVQPKLITESGTYPIKIMDSMPSGSDVHVYKIDKGYKPGEYLLLQYYRFTGKSGGTNCPGTSADTTCKGVVIYLVDEAKAGSTAHNNQGYPGEIGWPTNGNHYKVALLQQDRQYHLEKGNGIGTYADFYKVGNTLMPSLDPSNPVYPNTNSYQGGVITPTNVEVRVEGHPDPAYMNLNVRFKTMA